MSDLKVDGIIASTGTNTNLTLEGKGTGGVKITDYLVHTKGSDVSSATALTLGKDGNFFDVTGTTTITSIGTQGIGSCVTLQFDGALTFTHHSTDLILPGAANITTAAGDIAVMYEYASGDWRCVSYTKASGAAVVAAGGITIGTEIATTSGTTASFTGIPSGTKRFTLMFDGVQGSSTADALIQIGDSGGLETSAYDCNGVKLEGSSVSSANSSSGWVVDSWETTIDGNITFTLEDETNNTWTANYIFVGGSGSNHTYLGAGSKSLSAALTQVQVNGFTFNAGAMNISYE